MPKDQVISPKETRRAGEITFQPIPVMQYKSDYKKEVAKYGKDGLRKIYYDMLIIREFETMLNQIKDASLVVCTGPLEEGWLPTLLTRGGNPKIRPGSPGYLAAAGKRARP